MSNPPLSDRDQSSAATGVPPEKSSIVEDFVDIFYQPSVVFARRERSSFWLPWLIVSLVIGVVLWANSGVLSPVFDAEAARNIAAAAKANPQLTPEMQEKGRAFAEKSISIGLIVGTPIGILLVGVILWAVGKLFDSAQTLGAAMMVASFSAVPRVVGALVLSAQAFLLDPSKLTSFAALSISPARFLDPDKFSPGVMALLMRFDVFTIWATVLLAIGLAVTGRISRQKAAIAAFIVWLVATAPTLLAVARGG
jgi:hypothetical protein